MNLDFFQGFFRKRTAEVDPLAVPRDMRREALEQSMLKLVQGAADRIMKGNKYNNSQETELAYTEIKQIFDQVVLGDATLEEYSAACRRWEAVATK